MQTQTASSSHSKNLDIEVLRAIAILGTMVSHLDILFFWGSSRIDTLQRAFFFWGGVDLFFCISGYVITGNLLRTLPSGRQGGFGAFAIPFWIRRAWRILPSAWLWLAAPLILSVVANRTGYLGTPKGNIIDALSAVAQVANFHFWACYAFPATTCGIDQVYWSLSLEEQCYIVLPVLLYFANRRTIAPILCVVVLIQVFLPRPILSLLWFVRTDALALGALLALLQHRDWYAKVEPRPPRARFDLRNCSRRYVHRFGGTRGISSEDSVSYGPHRTHVVCHGLDRELWPRLYDARWCRETRTRLLRVPIIRDLSDPRPRLSPDTRNLGANCHHPKHHWRFIHSSFCLYRHSDRIGARGTELPICRGAAQGIRCAFGRSVGARA